MIYGKLKNKKKQVNTKSPVFLTGGGKYAQFYFILVL